MPKYRPARSEPIELDAELLSRIENIDWFSQCGLPFEDAASFFAPPSEAGISQQSSSVRITVTSDTPVVPVWTWEQALKCCTDEQWDAVTLWFSNELSSYLFHHCLADYSARWNRIARTVNDWFPVAVAPKIHERLGEQQESNSVVQDILRTVRGAVMEQEYRSCGHSVTFFTSLLALLEAGHYPCGWQLTFPDGRMIVF